LRQEHGAPIFLPSIFLPNPKHGNKMGGKNMERLFSCPQFSGRIPILVVRWSTGKCDCPADPDCIIEDIPWSPLILIHGVI
jgi:hypothetical protein